MEFWVETQYDVFRNQDRVIVRPHGIRFREISGIFIIESMSMDGLIGIELGIYSSYQQADMVMGEIRSHILAGDNYYKMPDDIGDVDYDEE